MKLLSYDSFKKFDSATALSIIDATSGRTTIESPQSISGDELNALFTPFDMKRLESYAESMIDYHVVLDLVPTIASLFFSKRLGSECTLSAAQQAILLALGLQRKPVDAIERELGLSAIQTLALFGKILRRITKRLQDIQKAGLGKDLPLERPEPESRKAVEETVEEELAEDVDEEVKRARAVQRELIDSMDMTQCVWPAQHSKRYTMLSKNRFAIDGSADFSTADTQIRSLASAAPDVKSRLSTTVSLKIKADLAANGGNEDQEKRKRSDGGSRTKKHKKVKA